MTVGPSAVKWALIFLGMSFMLCIAIIGVLAYVGDRPIPDVLVAVTTGILGLFGGILVPTASSIVIEDGEGKHEA